MWLSRCLLSIFCIIFFQSSLAIEDEDNMTNSSVELELVTLRAEKQQLQDTISQLQNTINTMNKDASISNAAAGNSNRYAELELMIYNSQQRIEQLEAENTQLQSKLNAALESTRDELQRQHEQMLSKGEVAANMIVITAETQAEYLETIQLLQDKNKQLTDSNKQLTGIALIYSSIILIQYYYKIRNLAYDTYNKYIIIYLYNIIIC